MFIDRQAIGLEGATSVERLRDMCVGCKDCTGACYQLIEMLRVPTRVLGSREAAKR